MGRTQMLKKKERRYVKGRGNRQKDEKKRKKKDKGNERVERNFLDLLTEKKNY